MNKRYTDKFLHFQNILFGWPYDIPMAPIWYDYRNEWAWLAQRIGYDSDVNLGLKKLSRNRTGANGGKYDEVVDYLMWWKFHKNNCKGENEYRDRLAQAAYMLHEVFIITNRPSYMLLTIEELTKEYDDEALQKEVEEMKLFSSYLDNFLEKSNDQT